MDELNENQAREQSVNERPVTLRDIAAELGISHVTVSKALRNLSGVSKSMKVRIQQQADSMGYVPNPLLASLSSYRKSSRTQPIQAEIAWINPWQQPDRLRQHHHEFDLYWQGANESAARMGYRLQVFNTSEIPWGRLQTILKSRNIQGVLLPPLSVRTVELKQFDWSNLAVVRFGQAIQHPRTHFVGSAQLSNTMRAFDRVRELGYQRVGFVCEYWPKRFFGAGYSWAQMQLPSEQRLPLLALNSDDDFDQQQCSFEKWLQQHRPDAILTDNSETKQMLHNLGFRIPEDVGLATTSIHDTTIDSGIDQSPFEIGRAAIRMLTALIAEKSFGLPEFRNETLIEGKWVDGSMLPNRHLR